MLDRRAESNPNDFQGAHTAVAHHETTSKETRKDKSLGKSLICMVIKGQHDVLFYCVVVIVVDVDESAAVCLSPVWVIYLSVRE